jgi:paraquat-inducible protein B
VMIKPEDVRSVLDRNLLSTILICQQVSRGTINTLRDTIEKLNGKIDPLVDGIDGATAQAQKTMATASDAIATIEAGIAPGSPMYFDLATALEELSAAARSLRLLSAFLERNPNALIRGKSK